MNTPNTPFRWPLEIVATGLHFLAAFEGEGTRRDVVTMDDIDLTEFERRYVERSHGAPASFRKFKEIWESGANRKALAPRARIVLTREAFFQELPPHLNLRRLAVVWTLGPDADFRDPARDAAVDLLLDMGSTFLLFGMWKRILAWVADLLSPMHLYVAKTSQPSDASVIRSIFDLRDVRLMEGVALNSEGVIVPAKSRCALIALGDSPTEWSDPSRCSPCDPACAYGQMDLCPHALS
ncbi:MAG: hypothetical protein LBT15_00385 [Synergistaceae bacterium]|jgi:hypothetical protein|nr:hypothetical protein [Synergistaceae bacterium]